MFRLFVSIALLSASVSATLIDRFYAWAETYALRTHKYQVRFFEGRFRIR